MAFTATPIVCSTSSPYGASKVASCNTRPAILAAVAERAMIRAQQIAKDSAIKRAAWEAEIALLRTPTKPKIALGDKVVTESNGVSGVKTEPVASSQPIAPPPVVTSNVKEEVKSGNVATQTSKPKEPPLITSSPLPKSLLAPQSTTDTEDDKKKQVETKRPQAQSIAVVSTEATATSIPVAAEEKRSVPQKTSSINPMETVIAEEKKSTQQKSSSMNPTENAMKTAVKSPPPTNVVVESNQETIRSGTGSKEFETGLRDVETTTQSKEKEKIVPTNVMDAVNGGKLKGLTVTKLRRMLSECGLKTSGRKSELIARLTSYVRK